MEGNFEALAARLMVNKEAVGDLVEFGAPKESIDEVKQRISRLTHLLNSLKSPLVATKDRRNCGFVRGGY